MSDLIALVSYTDLFLKSSCPMHSVPKFKESYKRVSKIKLHISSFMLYSVMNHYKEKKSKINRPVLEKIRI